MRSPEQNTATHRQIIDANAGQYRNLNANMAPAFLGIPVAKVDSCDAHSVHVFTACDRLPYVNSHKRTTSLFFARPLLESVTNPPQMLNKGLRHPWGRSFSSLTSHIRNDEWQYVVAINLLHHPDKQDGVFPICVQQRGTTTRHSCPSRERRAGVPVLHTILKLVG